MHSPSHHSSTYYNLTKNFPINLPDLIYNLPSSSSLASGARTMSIMKVVAVILDYIVAVVTIISDYTTSSQWVNYGKMEKESNHDCSSQWVAGQVHRPNYPPANQQHHHHRPFTPMSMNDRTTDRPTDRPFFIHVVVLSLLLFL